MHTFVTLSLGIINNSCHLANKNWQKMTIIYHLMIFVVARLSLFAARIAQHSSGLGGKWPGPLHTVGRHLGRRLHLQLQLLINTFSMATAEIGMGIQTTFLLLMILAQHVTRSET